MARICATKATVRQGVIKDMEWEGCGATLQIGDPTLRIEDAIDVARHGRRVSLSSSAREQIDRGRKVVARALAEGRVVYGVSTGFGPLSDTVIPLTDVPLMQRRILRSHASGTGESFPDDVVRAALLLRAHSLARGYSGVGLVLVDGLVNLLNTGVTPVVPCQGSVGASGDLAPLAHLSLPLIGEGMARVDGTVRSGREALAAVGLHPIDLGAKEAAALTNGTQITAALAALAVHDAERLVRAAEIAAALSFEGMEGHAAAYAPEIHELRPHPGQRAVARHLRALLRDPIGELSPDGRRPVQDQYSLRCVPQVLGPIRDALAHVRAVVEIEVNAVTDNPLCFSDSGEIRSGGNFHGHPLALACDYLKLALASLGAFTERRINSLVDPRPSGLPAFLTLTSGTNSGYMLAQYTAASLASENKVLAHPASADSIPTAADAEDYNSMGTTAARHLAQVVANSTHIVAIELLCAAQAIDLRGRHPFGVGTTAAYRSVRARVPFLDNDDTPLYELITAATRLVQSGELQAAVDAALGSAGGTDGRAT